jgi:glycerate dehydrogenase
LPRLKQSCVLATGYNVVYTFFARKQNVSVSNIPAYSTESVAQMVFALLLKITNQVGSLSRQVFNGKWTKSKDFCFYNYPLTELKDLTLGVGGYGKIVKSIIKKARAFEMNLRVLPE